VNDYFLKTEHAFQTVLDNWQAMQKSDLDEADEDAERFEQSFYRFTEELGEWLQLLPERPSGLEEALSIPDIASLRNRLPDALQLNFDMELGDLFEKRFTSDDEA
jgi:hypothetical protein